MVELELDVRQRVNIALICDAQDGNSGLVRVLNRIAEKIELSAEEKREFNYQPMPGGALWDKEADRAPALRVALESEDARVLSQVLGQWPHLKRADLTWFTRTQAALSQALLAGN